MWAWIPFLVVLTIEVAGATPILPRDVTITRTHSFVTRTSTGLSTTATYIAYSPYLTTETLDSEGRTITPSVPATTPTPMPEITVTQVVVTTTYLTSSISTPPSALPAFQSTALDVSKESVPAASSSSSQGAIGSTEGAGQANPKIVVIVGGTLAGLAVASILLFCVYLKLRKQRDIRGLFSPKQLRRPSWEVEPASGSARESSRVAPFPSSELPPTSSDDRPLSTGVAQPLNSTGPSSWQSATGASSDYLSQTSASVSARSEKHLSVPLANTPPSPPSPPPSPPPSYTPA